MHVKFRSLSKRHFGSIALVDLLPGGFELVVPAITAENTLYRAESANGEAQEDEAEYGNGEETNTTNVSAGAAVSGWTCQVCASGTTANLQYADMREDRMVFYTYAPNDIREITYRIKATNVGSFVLPPAYGEAMYDRNVVARSVAGMLTVIRAP